IFNTNKKHTAYEVPTIYAIPKLHKSPVKFRFITGAITSSLKPLSMELTKILSCTKCHSFNYNNTIKCRNTQYIGYWAINNITLNLRMDNITLFSADFTNMFTNLPHPHIMHNIKEILKICYENSNKYYIATNDRITFYTNDTSYCRFSEYIFKQKTVPQGSNVSPLLDDLTFSYFEYIYSINHYNNKQIQMKPFRYMDDILIIYNRNTQSILDELNDDTHENEYKCNYLDQEIDIVTNKMYAKMYNKTDTFGFSIKRFPNFTTNVSNRIKVDTIHSEILRIARTCSNALDFVEH
ncbi:hypothetical protein COOONC_00067, partial [Cooperia oncophora]